MKASNRAISVRSIVKRFKSRRSCFHPKPPFPIMLAVGAVVRASGFPDLRNPDPGLAPTDAQTDDPQLRYQRGQRLS